jgi:retron-type reverse transcriptase
MCYSLLEDMLWNRQFRVFVEDKRSKFRFLNNGLPQGSVLSPILFNLYTSNLPTTNSRKFIYADDLAMAYQHQNFENVENGLSDDLIPLNKYFTKW